MPKGFWYWLILVIYVVSWFFRYPYVPPEQRVWPWYAGSFVLLLLLIIIGLKIFSDPVSTLVTG